MFKEYDEEFGNKVVDDEDFDGDKLENCLIDKFPSHLRDKLAYELVELGYFGDESTIDGDKKDD